jgi:hypothetical protein
LRCVVADGYFPKQIVNVKPHFAACYFGVCQCVYFPITAGAVAKQNIKIVRCVKAKIFGVYLLTVPILRPAHFEHGSSAVV